MKKYLFNPYRGIYYEDGINRTGIKVLVVGDSHYCKGGCNESDRDLCLKNPFEKKICSVDDSFLCDYNMDNIYYYLKCHSHFLQRYIPFSHIHHDYTMSNCFLKGIMIIYTQVTNTIFWLF